MSSAATTRTGARREAGLTLMELLLAMALLGVLVTGFQPVVDGALRLLDRQDRTLRREIELGRFLDQWAQDVAAAHDVSVSSKRALLSLEEGQVRYHQAEGRVWRVVRPEGKTAWTQVPPRPIAVLEDEAVLSFETPAGRASVTVTGRGWSRTQQAALRRAMP